MGCANRLWVSAIDLGLCAIDLWVSDIDLGLCAIDLWVVRYRSGVVRYRSVGCPKDLWVVRIANKTSWTEQKKYYSLTCPIADTCL